LPSVGTTAGAAFDAGATTFFSLFDVVITSFYSYFSFCGLPHIPVLLIPGYTLCPCAGI